MSEAGQPSDTVALIPAAGGGLRLGQGPKAFLPICGKSLLQHVVDMVRLRVGRILVAVPADHVDLAKAQLAGRAEVHVGGTTRLGTLSGLFARCSEPLVVIHDAARPFASVDVLTQVIEAGRMHGAAAACRAIKVPVAFIENGFTKSTIATGQGGTFETPHAYQRSVLDRAFQHIREHAIQDEPLSDIVVRLGTPFRVVPDTEWNYKITTPLDWEIAVKVVGPMLFEAERKTRPASNQ